MFTNSIKTLLNSASKAQNPNNHHNLQSHLLLSTPAMLFKAATIVYAFAVLFASQAMGAVLIATDPVSACGPPRNRDHHDGSSCKYYAGPSDKSQVISGTCVKKNGKLTCVG
ncbi:hypothetical protein AAF712_007018 [Marasmius tenuissimus]|uniref:Uncharacterized protein n=1 Tax=Marasmius tenuissimus TaxID=585030 RepID=A0ABR2ZW42_9AGAR